MYYLTVGNGRAISPIVGRMCQLAVEVIQGLEAPAPARAAPVAPTEEPVPEPGRLGPDIPEPEGERVAATDRVPTAAEAAIDAERAIKFRGHKRVDSPATRITDATSKALNPQWRWDHADADETRAGIARKKGAILGFVEFLLPLFGTTYLDELYLIFLIRPTYGMR